MKITKFLHFQHKIHINILLVFALSCRECVELKQEELSSFAADWQIRECEQRLDPAPFTSQTHSTTTITPTQRRQSQNLNKQQWDE